MGKEFAYVEDLGYTFWLELGIIFLLVVGNLGSCKLTCA
jgi:hypothetical protein